MRAVSAIFKLAFSMAILCCMAGCANLFSSSPSATPTPEGTLVTRMEEITGIWQIFHPHWNPAYMILREDGTFSYAPNMDGSGPSESGKYWIEDNVFNSTDDFCTQPGKYAVYREDISGQSTTLTFTLISDDCSPRIKILTNQLAVEIKPQP